MNATIYYDTESPGWICQTADGRKYLMRTYSPDASDEELLSEAMLYTGGMIEVEREG